MIDENVVFFMCFIYKIGDLNGVDKYLYNNLNISRIYSICSKISIRNSSNQLVGN